MLDFDICPHCPKCDYPMYNPKTIHKRYGLNAHYLQQEFKCNKCNKTYIVKEKYVLARRTTQTIE